MKYILGNKIGMTQKFTESGEVVPVTLVKAGPCTVVQVKSVDTDGYNGVQVGIGTKKKINKAMKGHIKNKGPFKFLREFRDEKSTNLSVGDVITVGTFEVGEKVKVVGTSKGRGFQGVVKRHGFAGMPASHGTKDQVRMPGSIGATGPAHVFKGKKMPGRMGADQVSVAGLEIIEINEQDGIIAVKGAIPGPNNGLVMVKADGELKVNIQPEPVVEESKKENTEEVKAENEIPVEEKAEAPAETKAEEPKVEEKPEAAEEVKAEKEEPKEEKKEEETKK